MGRKGRRERERGRKGGRKGRREEGREEGRKGGREEGREGGREGGREEGRKGGWEEGRERGSIVGESVTSSHTWQHVITLHLSGNVKCKGVGTIGLLQQGLEQCWNLLPHLPSPTPPT